jgi:hypothetical protein
MVVGDTDSVSQWVMSSSSWMGQATPKPAVERRSLDQPAVAVSYAARLRC